MFERIMRRTQAWEQLSDPEYSSQLNMEQVHKLMLRAGFSEEEAQKAASKRAWERLDAGETL